MRSIQKFFNHSRFFLRFSALSFCVFGMAACSPDAPATNTATVLGTRTYKLDPEAAAIQLTVYGVMMGTPDASKFMFLMRTLKSAGEFSTVIEKLPGTEGGLTICGVFSGTANHDAVYDLIRSIETNTKETNFTASSVSGCTN